MTAWNITLAPVLPWPLLAGLLVLAVLIVGFGLLRSIGGTAYRAVGLAVILLALANPRYVQEEREPETDIALLVIDRSASQQVKGRSEAMAAAVERVREQVANDPSIELREVMVHSGGPADGGGAGGTNLFGPLVRAAASVPEGRYAGAVVVTDGQVHDLPGRTGDSLSTTISDRLPGPTHILLTGERDRFDRRLVIDRIPAYGIVGNAFEVAYRVIDSRSDGEPGEAVAVTLRINGQTVARDTITVGRHGRFEVMLDRAGVSVIEVTTPAVEDELSTINNTAVATVNAVRDRLRVLLVSGQPHAGERTWRNLLKSDPAVDLVHFTILRSSEKSDFTPINELALIAFPTSELFDLKLRDFDLVVFDRYVVRFVLLPSYFRNIRDYVTEGGAVMLAIGPEYAGQRSLFDTSIGEIAPARPLGYIIEQSFRPRLTDIGERHPVTADLGGGRDNSSWGRWLRQIPVEQQSGKVLMRGADDLPLLVLSRAGVGRIGLLASDQIWLWARDFEGGGPHAELIRRTAHWLMREPALEEERLSAELEGHRIRVERRTLSDQVESVTMTGPDGQSENLALMSDDKGLFRADAEVRGPGVYRFENGDLTAYLAVGDIDPLEYRGLQATADRLSPVVAATGGMLTWLAEDGVPDIRRPRPGRDMAGRNWIGLRANQPFVVTGLSERALLPGWLIAALVVGALLLAWWRESRLTRGAS